MVIVRPGFSDEDLVAARRRLKAVKPTAPDPLTGHIPTNAELQALHEKFVPKWTLPVSQPRFELRSTVVSGDRRTCTARNVKLLDKPLQVVSLATTQLVVTPKGVLHTLARAAVGALRVGELLGVVAAPFLPIWFAAPLMAAGPVARSGYVRRFVAAHLGRTATEIAGVGLSYVPHALTSALVEFKQGAAEQVDASIEQKLLRQACLPIPDKDALELQHGTATLARSIAEHSAFYSRPPLRQGVAPASWAL
jgi:hypothetical protein